MRLDSEGAYAEALARIGDLHQFVSAVLSGRLSNTTPTASRIDLRLVLVRGERVVQVVSSADGQQVTSNIAAGDVFQTVDALLREGYANITVITTTELWQCRITRRREALVHIQSGDFEQTLEHDRVKQRMLDESDPFLVAVGISTGEGRVKPTKRDKYLQVDDFLRVFQVTIDKEIEAGRLKRPTEEHPLRIVDLGCGHAYLTFAVQAWASRVRSWPVQVTGVDRRDSSVERNRQLAAELRMNSMTFITGNIADAQWSGQAPDVVLALHACDTATDDALAWAMQRGARVILAAPCCHHDVQSQVDIAPSAWSLVTRHGILRERLLDVVSDSLRAGIMRAHGYRTDVFEFVGGEHTPRNIMIRGVRTGVADESAAAEVAALSQAWGVKPALNSRLSAD
jgi:SAM-dependent methyltransferase